MTDLDVDPDEIVRVRAAFDDQLQDLARRTLDTVAPGLEGWQGCDWHRSGLHTALQTFAHLRGMSGTPEDWSALEAFARDVAHRQAEDRF